MNKFSELFVYTDILCSGMFSDALDELGFSNQVITFPQYNNRKKAIFGPVKTIIIEGITTKDERLSVGLGFLACCVKGDILVVQGSRKFAYFGELMTHIAIRQGIKGVIVDGFTRDYNATKDKDLMIISQGYTPKDIKTRGRVKEVNVCVKIGNIKVCPNDYIFADGDGVVVIPCALEQKLAMRISKMIEDEEKIKKMINSGKTVEEILNNFKAF